MEIGIWLIPNGLNCMSGNYRRNDYLDARNKCVRFNIDDYEYQIYCRMRDLKEASRFIDIDPDKAKDLIERMVRASGRELTFLRLGDPNYPISFVVEYLDPDERSMWIGLRDLPDHD